MTASIRRKLISDAVETRLRALPGMPTVTVYRGSVPDDPPPPVVVDDANGVVAPYVLFVPFGGFRPVGDRSVDGGEEDLDYGCQITCVAGYPVDCEALEDRVDAWIHHWTPTVSGIVFGRFEPPLGYDAGPVQKDTAVKPPRFYVPLNYRLRATR